MPVGPGQIGPFFGPWFSWPSDFNYKDREVSCQILNTHLKMVKDLRIYMWALKSVSYGQFKLQEPVALWAWALCLWWTWNKNSSQNIEYLIDLAYWVDFGQWIILSDAISLQKRIRKKENKWEKCKKKEKLKKTPYRSAISIVPLFNITLRYSYFYDTKFSYQSVNGFNFYYVKWQIKFIIFI